MDILNKQKIEDLKKGGVNNSDVSIRIDLRFIFLLMKKNRIIRKTKKLYNKKEKVNKKIRELL